MTSAVAALSALTTFFAPATAAQDELEFAVVSPSRVAVGKNVRIEGTLGTRYGVVAGELDDTGADPLVMRGDFHGLDEELDATLDVLANQIVLFDVNGDNRLRVAHPVEGAGLIGFPELVDYDLNGDVDDFDLFLDHYDANRDGGVTYNSEFASSLATEFGGIDDRLGRLIDEARPDRNGDGLVTPADVALGYRDGALDGRDAYAKVHGGLAFAVSRGAWEAARGASYQTVVVGPIQPEVWDEAVGFEVSRDDLPEITAEMLRDGLVWFEAQVPPPVVRDPGDPPVDPALLVDAAIAAGPGAEYVAPADGDWEAVPFGSIYAFDHYQRPVYRDYTFKNVRIPMGNNILFENCTFVGVTWIESEPRCTHQDWNYAGAVEPVDDGMGGYIYNLQYPDLPPPPPDHIDIDGFEVRDTRDYSNNIRFEGCTFLGSVAGDMLGEHTHWRNMVQCTGMTRSFLEVGEVDPPTLTDAAGTLLIDYLADLTDAERKELSKSSLFLPTWSVHLRNVDRRPGRRDAAPATRHRGLVVAGILEARGTLHIHGTLVSTFRPAAGEGPLSYGGHPSDFVTSIGFFEAVEGESPGFGAITVCHDPATSLPDGIP